MKIKMTLFGHLARLLPSGTHGNAALIDVEEGVTIADVLDSLGVPPETRGYLQRNGVREEPGAVLEEGDEVRVIVPLGGG